MEIKVRNNHLSDCNITSIQEQKIMRTKMETPTTYKASPKSLNKNETKLFTQEL